MIKTYFKNKNGLFIFIIFLILHLLPLFSVGVLLTLDGPSHLYNAKLFNEILEGNSIISELYQINTELIPNYLGHLMLSALLWLTTPVLALKIIHILYVVGISVSFRKLVLTLNPKAGLLSVLIFPFIYSELFLYGFYNFTIALIFLFITLRFWILNFDKKSILFFVQLTALFLLTYFAHSFTFLLLCLSIGVYTIVLGIERKDYWSIFRVGIKAFLAALPSIIFSISFVLKRKTYNQYLDSSELWRKLFNMSFLPSFEKGEVFYFLWIILIFLVVKAFKQTTKIDYTFLYLTIISCVLYFYMPDDVGYAGFFSVRMVYVSVVFLVLWLAIQNFSLKITWVVVAVVFVFQIQRMEGLKEWAMIKNNRAKEIIKIGGLIPENSIIKPITTINTWHYFHLSSLLGVKKPQIILDNYEAGQDYFPVKWKQNLEEQFKYHSSYYTTVVNDKEYKIDFLMRMGNGNLDNERDIEEIKYAEENFKIVYKTYFVILYKVEL